ncbi:MAG TPA: NAD(P)-dependent alcohol dehydrogenase [Anaeromyxobacteraceae bacterium]|nr:NAD(P)-dependent alcohol dehydrogenase [Anaeromyxobacteraceae bacterium]
MRIEALAAPVRGAPLEPFAYDAPDLGLFGCLVEVHACGVCRSDLHMIDDDWRQSRYPLVPGHEVVGIVREVGPQVTHLAAGQRVGVGWQRSACLACTDCLRGDENLCAEARSLIGHGHGGFASHVVVDARFAFRLPDAIPTEVAGPLLCGGATVYSALRAAGAGGGREVGVVGLGGLGHLAVQFAARLGDRVTVFTGSPDKAAAAEALGAARAVVVREGRPGPLDRPLDVLLSTAPAPLDWNAFLAALATGGTLSFVAAAGAVPIRPDLLMFRRRKVTGSLIGSRAEIVEMLDLAARLGVRPVVEAFPLAEANEALRRVRENRVRHRAVLRVR